uniref:Focadhesin n=1 Tax=Terrapene triunguis TaxID=2587831 RepID=A0A674K0Q7_9SAUR
MGKQTALVAKSTSDFIKTFRFSNLSENVVVRTACCEGLVTLVAQDYAEFSYVLNTALNLIPSARNVHGLVKIIGKLLQMQAVTVGKNGDEAVRDLYSIRYPPHPLITVLENRPDCWPVLLQQITVFFQQCPESSCVCIMTPFLRYLYCEPSQLGENAELRMGLLKILLQPHGPENKEAPSTLEHLILQLLCDLIPHFQIKDLPQITETLFFLEELFRSLLRYPVFWKVQLSQLCLQILCFCEICLNVTGECSSTICLIEQNVEFLQEDFPVEQAILGLALLLLQTPACQQKPILNLACKLLSCTETQKIPATAIILVMPVLQILSSTAVEDCISEEDSGPTRQQLAINLLEMVQQEGTKDKKKLVPNLIPVLMFKLGRPLEPFLYRDILYTLPTLGVHKVCIAQILRLIQVLGSTPKLRPITLRLMTSLWEKQDRVYPELQRFMAMSNMPSLSIGKDTLWEKVIAKAASIRDICRQRPYQHGADMLAAISQILNECTKPDQATPAALVLQGLHALCQAEVVCIRSTWNALSPKLSCDTRPLILKTLNELFALVPSLTVNTNEYEVCVPGLKCISSLNGSFKCLSITALKLWFWVCWNFLASLQPLTFFFHPLPPAFEEFVASLVKQEMANMPRGVYHSALRGGATRSDQGKTVAGVPNFMLKMYERNKQPGLKPGLAAGMLLCYDLPIHMGKDGKPISRFLASRGRNFQQMLIALIHEVSIQPSEWHRSLLLPQCWLGFMSRTYHAVLQGRQAELEMQLKHGKEDPEEVQYKQFTAWLWDSPVVKGNSILALTGLAVAVAKYENSLSSDTEVGPETEPDFLPTKHWISMVIETLLSIVNSRYRAKGQVFPWFYQKSYSGENTASAIARSCAATALSLLVPVFIVSCKEKVEEVLSVLTARLPGKPNADESQAVQIHIGLALGMFISRLFEEKVSDVSGQQINLLLMKSLDALEDCCFDTSLEYNTGCILGVGLVLSFMSHSSQTESRVHVSASLRKLCSYLDASEEQSRMFQEILAYSIACSCISAFSMKIIEAVEAEEIMNKLRTLAENNQQTSGFALALGSIVHGLSVCGHGKAEDLSNRLLPAWMKIVLAEMFTSFCLFFSWQLKSEAIQSSQFQNKLNEIIRTLTQIVSFSGVIGLQTNAAWLLGHLHQSSLSSTQNRTSVPPDFSYLPENSFIRAAIDFAIEGGKKGPESIPPHLVKVALAPIALVGESYQYPPVNWASVLSPLMRLNFAYQLCDILSLTEMPDVSEESIALSSAIHLICQKYLFTTLPLWMKHVAEDKLQTFTEVFLVQHFETKKHPKNPELCQSILQGLSQAMKLPSPAQYCWNLLCQAAEKIFELLPEEIQRSDVEMYIEVAKCLSEMADAEVDRIAQFSKNNIEKTTFIKVYLVSQGRLSLLSLNDVIGIAVRCQQKETIAWMLFHSFYHARIVSHENTGVLKRMDWLLELMGYIRNVAYKSIPIQNLDLKEAVDFLLWIFAASVVAWADHTAPLLLGLSASWSSWKHKEVLPELSADDFGKHPIEKLSVQETLTLLPNSVQLLLAKEPWKEQTQKFIDWLFNIMESPKEVLSESSRDMLKATLLALRFLPEFKKKAVWTKAYGW